MDLEQDCVGIAVEVDAADLLDVAALLALAPELAAAAAVVDGPSGAEGLLERLAVHPGEHQDFAAVGVLGDGGHEAAGLLEVDHDVGSPRCPVLSTQY